jgi:DNA-binding MarR family transcriptional regulator
MQNTRKTVRQIDAIAQALMALTGSLNSPRQDEVLLREAGVQLDRALFPLLIRLSAEPSISVALLAERVGRDASTVSRQISRLQQLGYIERNSADDLRVRAASVTPAGLQAVEAISAARRRLLGTVLAEWSPEERQIFPALLQRLADGITAQSGKGKARKARGLI